MMSLKSITVSIGNRLKQQAFEIKESRLKQQKDEALIFFILHFNFVFVPTFVTKVTKVKKKVTVYLCSGSFFLQTNFDF